MTEYWVSKKQYWCKYCSIWIRDDAPSKKHHETGLKHIGNRERYIRDLYKTGNKAKADRAEEAAELAKIEAAALKSGDTATKLTLLESLRAQQAAHRAGGHKARASAKGDAFANYTSAADLGFKDEETEKTSYEIEQELKGRAGEVGAWEEVSYEPQGAWSGVDATVDEDGTTGQGGSGSGSGNGSARPSASTTWGAMSGEKRKLGEYDIRDDEDHEDFDFIARSHAGPSTSTSTFSKSESSSGVPTKRKPRLDPYDQDDWDPRAAIKGKARLATTGDLKPKEEHVQATNLDREAWGGKLELRPAGAEKGMMYVQGGGWVKGEGEEDGAVKTEEQGEEGKDGSSTGIGEIGRSEAAATSQKEPPGGVEPATPTVKTEPGADTTTGMFKKRRPPPSSRKK